MAVNSKTPYVVSYRLAPTEAREAIEKIGFNEAHAFADNHARHNKLFHCISISEKATGEIVYCGAATS